jgi:RHS repeat-associated protein
MNQRYQSPEYGIFISTDKVTDTLGTGEFTQNYLHNPQGLSPYSYTQNDPVNKIDPDGRFAIEAYVIYKSKQKVNQAIENTPNIPNTIRELNFASQYPLTAYRVGTAKDGSTANLSSVSSNFAINITRSYTDEVSPYTGNQVTDISERNGLRHLIWQGILNQEFGSDISTKIGDSHEYNPNADITYTTYKNKEGADQSVDLFNNMLGRKISRDNPGVSRNELVSKVLDFAKNEGFYTAQPNLNGGYSVGRSKLSNDQYNYSSTKLKNLNAGGLNK